MTFRERLQLILRVALILFILASVAFLSAITAMRFAIQGREVAMPDVTGKKSAEAQQILQGHRVGFRVEDRIYSTLPLDEVVRQVPTAGMRVKIGQDAHVILSLGPQRMTIPQLTDKSLRAARIELLRGGMQLGEIASVYLPSLPTDTVIQQDPAPGTSDVTSSHVDMLVSLGPRPPAYVMPDLIGEPLSDAESKLNAAGLKISKITPWTGLDATHGSITGQTPTSGQRVDTSTAVELQVAE